MRVVPTALLVCLLSATISLTSAAQFSLPGFGTKSAAGNDAKAAQLLHDKLPLVLDANSAYPTVPDRDMLGGPFRGQLLHITLDTLTKPLAPGDYVLPMTFFCSEYSIHRPGAGTAYVLAPARGTSARAISTLLWRGMLAGYKPQDLQSVSWAIQGSVPYSNMPPAYRTTIDQLIPDMKNQVNGQAFLDIEDGFQGKVNRFTRKVNQGMTKATGGYVKFDLKVDLELNDSFTRLGRLGRSALDGEHIADIVQDLTLSDAQRQTALYAGQGSQAPPLPAANGPWSVIVPGVAYMRFTVHGGNLQGDNVMQVRILKPGAGRALMMPSSDGKPHLTLAQYSQSTPEPPSLLRAFNGTFNQATYQQCLATGISTNMCPIRAIEVNGATEDPIGASQISISAPAGALSPQSDKQRMCLRKLVYEPSTPLDEHKEKTNVGLCIFLGVFTDVDGSCDGLDSFELSKDQRLNWVQTYETNYGGAEPSVDHCKEGIGHANLDQCDRDKQHYGMLDLKKLGPMYRPDSDSGSSSGDFWTNLNSDPKKISGDFRVWAAAFKKYGDLKLIFRDIPNRNIRDGKICKFGGNDPSCGWTFHTTPNHEWNAFVEPSHDFVTNRSKVDRELRLVRYSGTNTSDPDHFEYTPLISLHYGVSVSWSTGVIKVDPLSVQSLNTQEVTEHQHGDLAPGGNVTIKDVKLYDTIKVDPDKKMESSARFLACSEQRRDDKLGENPYPIGGPPTIENMAPFPFIGPGTQEARVVESPGPVD